MGVRDRIWSAGSGIRDLFETLQSGLTRDILKCENNRDTSLEESHES